MRSIHSNNISASSIDMTDAATARAGSGSLYTPWLLPDGSEAADAAAAPGADIAPVIAPAIAPAAAPDNADGQTAGAVAGTAESEGAALADKAPADASEPPAMAKDADSAAASASHPAAPLDPLAGSAAMPDMAALSTAPDVSSAASVGEAGSAGNLAPDRSPINPTDGPVGAPGPAATLQTLADYLRVGFWNDFLGGASQRYYNVDDNGTGANFGVLYYNVTWSPDDSNGISAARATMVREAFNIYEAVLGIDFIETTSQSTSVDYFFGDNVAGQAYAYSNMYAGNSGVIDNTVINVASAWNGGSSSIGDYTFQTFIHEIGHGLGLGHQGNYNAGAGTPTYATSAQWENDSWALTMMSYWDQVENTSASTLNFTYAQLVSPMTVDWIALNNLYAAQDYVGRSFGTDVAFTGNTVWGVGTNISSTTSAAYNGLAGFADSNAFTIVDGGGIDTIDFSTYGANQVINLNPASTSATNATISSVGGYTGNMTIAAGTTIENAIGGSGNDTLTGNAANNNLEGRGGSDSLIGNDGDDTVDGGTGIDNLNGGFGNDLYIVDNLGDVAGEVAGGVDTVQSSVNHILSVNLENLTLTGSADIFGTGNDSRANVIVGNSGANTLSGGFLNDTLNGGTGDDTLFGGSDDDVLAGESGVDSVNAGDGNDVIRFTSGHFYDNVDGGAGNDTLDATAVARNGDTFDFETGLISGYPGGQTVTGIELFLGGSGDETIISDGSTHSYFGNGGNDTMIAEIGNETMDGGAGGTDTIDLSRWTGAYIVDMNTGSSNYGGELFTNFENLISGAGNDSITGTTVNNVINTNGGNDSVNAGAGADTVNTGDGDDVITDTQSMGAADDDVYDGGTGIDTLVHDLNWVSSVGFDLTTGFATYTGNRDQLINIENLTVGGSASLRGSSGANVLIVNGAGANLINGEAGKDTVNAGDGDDIITDTQGMSASDDDVYDGGAGIDTLVHDLNWVSAVSFDLTTGFSTYSGNRDQLINIENLTVGGSASVRGNAVANVLIVNGTGANAINGEAGNDTVNAGDGDDTITDTQTIFSTGQEDDV
jgi:Ca2+-binding RTX toxin-like protein